MITAMRLQTALAVFLCGCAAPKQKQEAVTLAPFIDTFRWHTSNLTKESPSSADGDFQLVGVSPDGNVELIYLPDGTHHILKLNASIQEIAGSPMRVIKSDAKLQSAELARLTTN
jgi:hypothetical protein